METQQKKETITIETTINSPIEKVWDYWSLPEHITQWSFASDEWHTPSASNDLRTGGKFSSRMEAKDGSMGFDFGGVYDDVQKHKYMEYTLGDNRKVKVYFSPEGKGTKVIEEFEAEEMNSLELQKNGWQAILDNFKRYTENN